MCKWLKISDELATQITEYFLFKVWVSLLAVILIFIFGAAIGVCYIETMTSHLAESQLNLKHE